MCGLMSSAFTSACVMRVAIPILTLEPLEPKLDDSKNALKIFVPFSFILFFGWILVDFFLFLVGDNISIKRK